MPIACVVALDPDPVPDPVPDPIPDPVPDPTPVPDPIPLPDPVPDLTPEQHAQAAWSWLKAQCAPSTWKTFTHSVAVRAPESKGWTA